MTSRLAHALAIGGGGARRLGRCAGAHAATLPRGAAGRDSQRWYGVVFISTKYSLAFTSSDVGYVVREALKAIRASQFAATT